MSGVRLETGMRTDVNSAIARSAAILLFLFAVAFFSYLAMTSFQGAGLFDFAVFYYAGRDFDSTGFIYDRVSSYAPNLNVYKFPPLVASIIVLGCRYSRCDYADFFDINFVLHGWIYVVAVALLAWRGYRKSGSEQLALVLFSVGLLFYPLLETNIIRLQVDIYVFFFLVLAYLLLDNGRQFLSGMMIAVAVSLKVYPFLILGFLLAWRLPHAIAGFVAGFLLCLLVSSLVVGIDENVMFYGHILPILLRELPNGGGDGNISLPTMLIDELKILYLFPYTGVWSADEILSAVEAGRLTEQEVFGHIDTFRKFMKLFTGGLLVLLTLFIARACRVASRDLDLQKDRASAAFAAFVVFTVVFMPNSWINYQVILVLPILILLSLTRAFTHGVLLLCCIPLWFFSGMDTLSERVAHFPPWSVPAVFSELSMAFPGGTALTGWGRCLSALGLLVVALACVQGRCGCTTVRVPDRRSCQVS